MAIRKTVNGDRPAIIDMIEASANLNEIEKECAVELLDIYLEDAAQRDYSFIVDVDDGDNAVGYACYGLRPLTDGTYDLYWIVVDPAHRRRGVGARLVDAVVERLKADKARILVAETSGTDEYAEAADFYRKSGFVLEASIKEFYRPGDDLRIFVRRL